jgi:hypothetical protein
MATLYISYIGAIREHVAAVPFSSETITTSTTSAASGTVPQWAKAVSIVSDTAHYVTIGTGTPTAAASNSIYIPANQVRELSIGFDTANAKKIAAITLS